MSRCTKCGAEIVPGMPFCSKCGTPISLEKNVPQFPTQPSSNGPRPPQPPTPKPAMPTAPKQPTQGFPQQPPSPNRPTQPQAPRPAAPTTPQRPMQPEAPQSGEKGFFNRVGAGVASAVTGGSFNAGYERQRQNEETNDMLVQGIPLKLQDAKASFEKFKKNYPQIIDSIDEIEFGKLIADVENAVNNTGTSAAEHNKNIKRALAALDKKLHELGEKVNPTSSSNAASQNNGNTRNRQISTVELNDINPDELAIVGSKATWGIQRGQIARRITERELYAVDGLDGVIIQHGCSALIFLNGELVKVMDSGAYKLQVKSDVELKKMIEKLTDDLMKNHGDKIRKEEEEKKAKQQNLTVAERGGLFGIAGGWIKRGLQFVFGAAPVAKNNDNKDKELEAMKRFKAEAEKIVKKENEQPLLSVILISNRLFSLIFGCVENEDGVSFSPYKIPVGIFDVGVGVEVEMRISDISTFATNYLTDRNCLLTNDVSKMLNFEIENILRQELRNREYTQQGFDAELRTLLSQKIQASINNRLHGIECSQVLNITDSQDDVFERFRQVEKEIYCSEKELEFLARTGEIKNRMEQEQNKQLLNSARNKEDYSYAMQQIDKDHLLHDDEMAEFVMLLETQRMVREATTKEEAHEKLLALEGNRFVKEDELEAIKDAIEHDRINRAEITNIMRIQSDRKVEMERMQAEFALNDTRTDHDWEREDLERRRNWGIEDEEREREWMREEREYNRDFDRRVKEDDYDFQKMMRERAVRKEDEQLAYERARQDKFDEDQLDANRSQRQMDKLQAMARMQAELDAQKYKHEENLAQVSANERMNRDNTFANMSAEQIRAAQLDRLSVEGQVAMSQAYSSEKEAEFMRTQMERERENAQRDKASMMDFAREMAGMVRDTATSINNANQQRINDLQYENRYQQQRYDRAQDTAMNNIAQVSTAAAGNINAFNGGLGGYQQHAQPAQQHAQPVQPIQSEMIECQCYNCGQNIQIAVGTPQCPQCGAPFQW